MWINILSLFGFLLLANALPSHFEDQGPKSYKGYKLIRTIPIGEHDKVQDLMILDGMSDVQFWTYPVFNQSVDILASEFAYENVQKILNRFGVSHNIVIHDINELIRDENPIALKSTYERQNSRMTWDNYHRYDVIKNYCHSLGNSKAGMVSTQVIGKSTEGRDIIMTKVSRNNGPKPAIFVDGGMHAREWISPATVTYIMNKLISESSGPSSDLIDSFDWYFVPVINVDGYEYSHVGDRLWRKTRSRANYFCRGTDPNRNWDFQWGKAGSSTNPCSDIYAGPKAFSEPETKAVADAILGMRNQIKMYLTFHSYSQLWLIPYGCCDQKPKDYNELLAMGNIGKNAIESTYGTKYKIGTAPDLLYKASGGSDDWAKGAAGIKYSYTVELRDTGRHGFVLPASQIKPTGEETYNGVAALVRALKNKL